LIAALLLCLLADAAITPTATPDVLRGPETLHDFAARRKLTPRAVADAGRATIMGSRVKLESYRETRIGNDLAIEGVLQNLQPRDLDVLVKVNAIDDDGRAISELIEPEAGQKVPASARAKFRARLPRAKAGSVKLTWVDPIVMGTRIETAADKTAREMEKTCLELHAVASGSQIVEVRAHNRCAAAVPAERTWFLLTVKDSAGLPLGHRDAVSGKNGLYA